MGGKTGGAGCVDKHSVCMGNCTILIMTVPASPRINLPQEKAPRGAGLKVSG